MESTNNTIGKLATIADAIEGQVWHSGGGLWGILKQMDGWEMFFGFADGVLGWDINTSDGDELGYGESELTIDQTEAVIARCLKAISDWLIANPVVMPESQLEFGGETFHTGDLVIYSVYPAVANGTGIVDICHGKDIVRSTGETFAAMTAMGMGDTCPWEHLYNVRHAD